ncbi:MAG: sugar transferase [Pseudomonadota bacterium]|nr:sugar transferase [Pseudomonadota bacterium]
MHVGGRVSGEGHAVKMESVLSTLSVRAECHVAPNPPPGASPIPATTIPATTIPAINSGLRWVDVIVAAILLLIILPVWALIALAIRLTSAGPIIFAHDRVGLGGQMFSCLKFRSMALDADDRLVALLATDSASRTEWAQDHKLKNDPRITRVGRFLRKSSLDELPQLLNVLRGEMSLVGPRPIVPSEMVRYGRYIRHYCSVRPGITGMWQISGRSDVSYPRRVALDVLYIRSRSLSVNLYILGMTLLSVIMAEGSC